MSIPVETVPRSRGEAVAEGLAALARMQTREGYFPFYVAESGSRWRRCDPIFATAYIMTSVGRLLPPGRIAAAVDYVASCRRVDGFWHFDPSLAVPPDADTTACALAALALEGRTADTAGGTELLRSFWRMADGPFRTWRVDGAWSAAGGDDPVVNCHLLHALNLLGAPATAAERAAVASLVRRSESGSRRYSSPGAIALACRRGEIGEESWPQVVAAPPNNGLGFTQWYAATGRHGGRFVPLLLAAQRPDGSWPVTAWMAGIDGLSWGSPAITTALAVEALRAWPVEEAPA